MNPRKFSHEALAKAKALGFKVGGGDSRHDFAATSIANLWEPEIWTQAAAEPVVGNLMLLNSGAVAQTPQIQQVAQGGGKQAEMPRFRQPKVADEIQKEGEGPTIQGIDSNKMVAPILNRIIALGASALSGAVSDTDPIGFIGQTIGINRLYAREITLLSILRGFMGTAAAANSEDNFSEDAANPPAANLIDSMMVIDALARLGENISNMTQGAMVVHSTIHAALQKQDDVETIKDSEGNIILSTYRGMALFINDLLVRDATTAGKVYDSYILGPGTIAMGDRPQSTSIGDVASITRKEDAHTNEVAIYDRTRFVLHPSGAAWKGKPTGDSASNTELANPSNWDLAGDPRNVGIVRIRTNG